MRFHYSKKKRESETSASVNQCNSIELNVATSVSTLKPLQIM